MAAPQAASFLWGMGYSCVLATRQGCRAVVANAGKRLAPTYSPKRGERPHTVSKAILFGRRPDAAGPALTTLGMVGLSGCGRQEI